MQRTFSANKKLRKNTPGERHATFSGLFYVNFNGFLYFIFHFRLKEKYEALHPPPATNVEEKDNNGESEINLSELIHKFRESRRAREEREKEREEKERERVEREKEEERMKEERKKRFLTDLRTKMQDRSIYNLDYLFPPK